tara:strand:+ start:398 stop:787 length:390 start_codon:yes stop_codon:yes gene_type:complete
MGTDILNDTDAFLKEIEEQKIIVKELVSIFNEKAEAIVRQYFEKLSAQDIVYFAGNNTEEEISFYDICPKSTTERDAQERSKTVEDFVKASQAFKSAKKTLKNADIILETVANQSRVTLKYSYCQPDIK